MTYKVVVTIIDFDGSDGGNGTKEFYSKSKAKAYADDMFDEGNIIEGIYRIDAYGYETEINL